MKKKSQNVEQREKDMECFREIKTEVNPGGLTAIKQQCPKDRTEQTNGSKLSEKQ